LAAEQQAGRLIAGSGHSSSPAYARLLDLAFVIYATGGDYGHPDPVTAERFSKADQFVTTRVSEKSWPNGFPAQCGSVVGEIHIRVARDGSRFQVNDQVYPSLTDAQEAVRGLPGTHGVPPANP
jgi:hypothetical protein